MVHQSGSGSQPLDTQAAASTCVTNSYDLASLVGHAVTGSTSDLPFLFKQLETLSPKDTAALSDLIQNWVDSH